MTAKVTKNGQVIEVQTEDLSLYYAKGWKPVEEDSVSSRKFQKKTTEPKAEEE